MGRLFEGFEILCTDYDHMLEERADIIQGRTLYKGGHYSRKYGISFHGTAEGCTNFEILYLEEYYEQALCR